MQKSFDATRNEPSLHLRRARCHGHGFSPLRFAALREAGYDAVDGSSTGTRVPSIWVLLGPP